MPATRLLERGPERSAIEAALDAALDGRGALVLLEGEAGVGKTSLLQLGEQLAAERDMRVLRARGGELERDLPYGVVRQLFEATVVAEPDGALLTGAAALAAPVFDLTVAPSSPNAPATQHGLFWLAADLAAREPLVALIDDAQWADAASLHTLLYIARRLDGMRAALLLTVRTGEPDAPQDLLAALSREPLVTRLAPSPLSLEAAAGISRDALGADSDEPFLAACWRSSGGNPFLLTELLRALAGAEVDPTAVNAGRIAELVDDQAAVSIVLRVRRLGDPALRVARAVAVLEPDTELEHIAAVSELQHEEVTALCEQLIAAHLLTDDTRPAFVHPLLKEAVYRDVAAPRRGALHLLAARALRAAGADSGTVAAHLLRCPATGASWVVGALRDAAREARARGAPQTAARYLQRAIAEPPPADELLDVREDLGTALLDAADARGVDELLAVREASEDPIRRAEIAITVATSLVLRGRATQAEAILSASLDDLGVRDGALAAHLRAERYVSSIWTAVRIDRSALLRDTESVSAGTLGERQLLSVASLLLSAGLGRREETLAVGERLADAGDVLVADAMAGWMRGNAALPFASGGNTARALALLDGQLGAARRRGSTTQVAITSVYRAIALLMRGDLAEAETDAAMAAQLIGEAGMAATWPSGAMVLIVARLERGDLAGAGGVLPADGAARDLPRSILHGQLAVALGRLRAAKGDHAAARDLFLAAGERLDTLPYPEVLLGGWRPRLALAEHALGETERARAVAAEAVVVSREAGYGHGIAMTLRVQGMLAGAEGVELLREAVETASATEARLEHAYCLVELGAALRRAQHRRESRDPLRTGLDLAHRCGARPLEERARIELAAAGARPRSVVLSGVDSLTPSEQRVARLAADGLTNREIAQELFVTTKTVETQLRAAFRKLDIARRGDLTDALG